MGSSIQNQNDRLRERFESTGVVLRRSLSPIARGSGDRPLGPQRLATYLGIDKVLASRFLSAMQSRDPLGVLHRMPGPAPLRRLVRAGSGKGLEEAALSAASAAVEEYEALIRDVGDRSALDSVLSAWLPEARREFELRRKQAAHRAISQIHGVEASVFADTCLLTPNTDGETINIVWCKCLVDLCFLRPGARVLLSSIRSVTDPDRPALRRPTTLTGMPFEGMGSALLPEFSSPDGLAIESATVGEAVHHLLDEKRLPLGVPATLTTCEVNRAELPRFIPTSRGRRAWTSSEIEIPARRMQFDLAVHEDLFPEQTPRLDIYDTAIRGHADPNEPSRAFDLLPLMEEVESLAGGLEAVEPSRVPRHGALLAELTKRLDLDPPRYRIYRVTADYPLYGSQTVLSFATVDPPA